MAEGSTRVLRNRVANECNRVVNEWAGRESEVPLIPPSPLVIGRTRFAGIPYPMPKFSAILPTPDTRGDVGEMAMATGQAAGRVDEDPPATEIVRGVVG